MMKLIWYGDALVLEMERNGEGSFFFRVKSERVMKKAGGQELVRSDWALSQLVVFDGTPEHEARRMLRHWASYFESDTLTTKAVEALSAGFAEVFAPVPEAPPEPPPPPAGSQGLN